MYRLQILVATNRPLVQLFFSSLGQKRPQYISISHVSIPLKEHVGIPEAPMVALIDITPDPVAALQLCQELHLQYPQLAILALLCCPHLINQSHLQKLVAAGVSSILDLHLTADQILHTLEMAAHGESMVQFRLTRNRSVFLSKMLCDDEFRGTSKNKWQLSEKDTKILELVAQGFSDCEIGCELHLSSHTVKHHIERLRMTVDARSRVELAAWAGQIGLYHRAGQSKEHQLSSSIHS